MIRFANLPGNGLFVAAFDHARMTNLCFRIYVVLRYHAMAEAKDPNSPTCLEWIAEETGTEFHTALACIFRIQDCGYIRWTMIDEKLDEVEFY